MSAVLLDTGPLVAFLDRRDRHHEWAKARWGELIPPLLTCESVVSESCFLMKEVPFGRKGVMELLSRGVIKIAFDLGRETKAVAGLMARYDEVPMSLADACLVRMSEQYSDCAVFSIDGDFRLYRRHSRGVIPLISPL